MLLAFVVPQPNAASKDKSSGDPWAGINLHPRLTVHVLDIGFRSCGCRNLKSLDFWVVSSLEGMQVSCRADCVGSDSEAHRMS
eukprot:2080966-Amphidinium_carterae.1